MLDTNCLIVFGYARERNKWLSSPYEHAERVRYFGILETTTRCASSMSRDARRSFIPSAFSEDLLHVMHNWNDRPIKKPANDTMTHLGSGKLNPPHRHRGTLAAELPHVRL